MSATDQRQLDLDLGPQPTPLSALVSPVTPPLPSSVKPVPSQATSLVTSGDTSPAWPTAASHDLAAAVLQPALPTSDRLPVNLSHRAGLPPVLQALHAWADKGWLRRLDSALADHLFAQAPASPPALWVAVACLSHLEGRGHTCLPLALLCNPGAEALSLPPEAQPDVTALWAQLPVDVSAWQQALASSTLVALATHDDGMSPLVLCGGGDPATEPLLYLRRYWHDEGDVVSHIRQRVASPRPVDESAAAHWLARCFAPGQQAMPGQASRQATPVQTLTQAPTQASGLTAVSSAESQPDWQQWACALALRAGLTVITGGPGTGKTYTAARLLALLFALSPHPQQMRVALAAPTGKAAARLRQSLAQSLVVLAPSLAGVREGGHGGAHEDALDLAALTQRMGPARTLHSLLGVRPDSRRFVHNVRHPLDVDVLVVDEASMINLEMMAALMRALPAHAQLVLLGDKDQLSSVEAGAVLGDLCRHAHWGHYGTETARYLLATTGQATPPAFAVPVGQAESALAQQTVMLRHSHRFAGAIGQLALAVNAGQVAEVARLLASAQAGGDLSRLSAASPKRDDAHLLSQLAELAVAGYGAYLRAMVDVPTMPRTQAIGTADTQPLQPPDQQPDQLTAMRFDLKNDLEAQQYGQWVRAVLTAFEGFRLLCAVHQGPFGTQGLNQRVQAALARAGLLNPRTEWFAGRPIMVTRNDPGLGVSNGDVGVVLPGQPGPDGKAGLKACFLEGDTLRTVPVGRLAHVETAFAMTVHKSQGSEFAHAVLVLPPHGTGMLTRELVYTGITRARQQLTVVEGVPDALVSAVQRQASRHSGLAARLAAACGG